MDEKRRKVKRLVIKFIIPFLLYTVLVFLGIFILGIVIEVLGNKAFSMFFESFS